MPTQPLNLAVIPGDGTGPEVVREAIKVLKVAAKKEKFTYKTTTFDFGGERYLKTGQTIDSAEINHLRQFDAIMLGALGHPQVKPGILEKGILLRLRFELDQYINLRPVHLYPGVDTPLKDKGPREIDFDVIRENTEDLYCGNGGIMRQGTPQEVSTQEMIATRFGAERCIRYAYRYCLAKKKAGNGRGKLTLVHKTNVLTFCGDTWFRAFHDIGQREFPTIERDYNHVDACCMWFVKSPEFYDTIVVPNMFGDIITDLAAIIQGGLGVAAGGNINPDPRPRTPRNTRNLRNSSPRHSESRGGHGTTFGGGAPSMFEPMGGSAPKYTGLNVINPLAAIGAMAMLLQQTGEQLADKRLIAAGNRIDAAIRQTTPRMASQSAGKMGMGTDAVGDLVCELL